MKVLTRSNNTQNFLSHTGLLEAVEKLKKYWTKITSKIGIHPSPKNFQLSSVLKNFNSPPNPGSFYSHRPPYVQVLLNHYSTGGKKHENVNLIQKLIQRN